MNLGATANGWATDTPVLVVGGGAVGLTTALLLARLGIPTQLVERHPGTAIHPRARGLNVRTMEIFRALGLEGRVREAGAALASSRYVLWVDALAGAEIRRELIESAGSDADLIARLSPTDWASCAQDELEPILATAARTAGARLRFGTELVAATQDGAGVTATIVDRVSGVGQTVRAPHVWLERGGRRRSTLDRFGQGFVLLAGPAGQAWCVAARQMALDAYRVGADGGAQDEDDAWCAAYGVSAAGAVVVRPDGFVGWRTVNGADSPAEALAEALASLRCGEP